MELRRLLTPNESLNTRSVWLVLAGWCLVFLGYWTLARPVIFPSPADVVAAFPTLWFQDGLGQELITSFGVNVEALLVSVLVAFPLAYLCRTPITRPLALGVAKLRFVSPAVFFLVLLFSLSGGHQVKVAMLALGEIFFLVTTLVGIMDNIPAYQFDDARTLRMSEWQTVWYVNVRGTLAAAIDAVRDNAAMGWSMLIMVEGIVRAEGGVGVLMLNQEKHLNIAETYAIAAAIIAVGVLQDYALGVVKNICCPYAATQC